MDRDDLTGHFINIKLVGNQVVAALGKYSQIVVPLPEIVTKPPVTAKTQKDRGERKKQRQNDRKRRKKDKKKAKDRQRKRERKITIFFSLRSVCRKREKRKRKIRSMIQDRYAKKILYFE